MTLARFSGHLPSLFDHFFDNELFDWSNRNFSTTNTTLPSVNIKDTEEAYKVEMAAPGLSKEDFKVELNQNILTISSEKKSEEEKKEGEQFTRREFSYQSFSRSFTLPDIVDADKIEARYESGVLLLSIPKKEEAKPKPAKMIEIK
ncbi:heat-shock protein [Alkalitalea saponilacus]|uniref:HSP20 family protein n=2 Tax=Alkalitalea saponilacus TaxID=889453 RepID=A0A1T5C8F8_9BACT|nr:heat-shock protein [Alkalitalea saponilacus]SKB55656.1 HSP20 family protein [Alkalitalea saponilacus]